MRKLAIIIFALLLTSACADNAPVQPTNNTTPTNSSATPATSSTPATGEVGKTITTPSGLQYVDLTEGTGASPQEGQTITVHYTGTFPDGKKFQSSLDSGTPLTFPIGVSRVIKGWDEGILTMKVGGKRKLIIPPQLGYGATGKGSIPPNATLIFEVELLSIEGQGGQQ